MKNNPANKLWLLAITVFLSACSSSIQSTPQAPNTLPPTWTQTLAPSQTATAPFATRTITPTSTTAGDRQATFDAFQTANAVPSDTRTPNRFELTNIANTNLMRTPSPTSTEGPALRAQTWIPDPVLVEVWRGSGDGCCFFDSPPDIILYSTGQLILSERTDWFRFKPLTRNLDRKSMCQLLNTIDQTGFFDYDPSIYRSPYAGGGPTFISINTWESNQAAHEDLYSFIIGDEYENIINCDRCIPPPTILPALSDIYKLLFNYNPGGMKYYQPEKMIVWISEYPSYYQRSNPIHWPISSPTLHELVQQTTFGDDYIIIEGDVVRDWYEQVPSGLYFEGELEYEIFSRPMWPYEKETDRDFYGSSIPNNEYPTPTEPIECKVIDGVLDIPQ